MTRLRALCKSALTFLAVAVAWWSITSDLTAHGQGQQPAVARFNLTLPVTSAGLRETLARVSVAKRVAFGIELARGTAGRSGPRDSAPRLEYAVDLTSLSVPVMLDRIVSEKTTTAGVYEWAQEDGIYTFRPALFRNNREVALNRVIARFETSRTNVVELLFDVHRLFDQSYASRPQPAKHMPQRVQAQVNKAIALSMANVTVRSILNEIVRRHGQMSWVADYTEPNGRYRGLKLSFVGFDNWTVSATAHSQ